MTIAIVPNTEKHNCFTFISMIYEKLIKLGAKIIACDCLKQHLETLTSIQFVEFDLLFVECDLVIAVGGDGTIIRAAKKAALHSKPVLGINIGRLGFMAGLEIHELDELDKLFSGEYFVDHRMLLRVSINDASFYALNDAVVSKGELSRTIDLKVELNDKTAAAYRGDGVIISTPTGSTAYSLSAGGPVVDPSMSCLILTPICPHSLFSRSIMFSENANLKVMAAGCQQSEMYVTIDGEQGLPLVYGDAVLIRKSRINVSLIRLKTQEFYEILNEKLLDRRL